MPKVDSDRDWSANRTFGPRSLVGGAILILAVGCGSEQLRETTLAGHSADLVELLDACAGASKSPASKACSALADQVRPCEAVVAVCSTVQSDSENCSLIEEVQCVEPTSLSEAGLSEGEGWLFRGPLPGAAGHGVLELRGIVEATGAKRIVGRVQSGSQAGWRRWLPAARGPGPFKLDGANAFLHLRWRPEAGLLPERGDAETLADRLYGLRAELFTATVLTGNVELVFFVPKEGAAIPGSAVALDFHLRGAAVAAMEAYIKNLQKEWPLTRTDYRSRGWQGACLGNLRVLPDLAPCYVATDDAIVAGWNRESLEAALGSRTRSSSEGGNPLGASDKALDSGRVEIRFDQLALADRRLADSRGRGVAYSYPFSALELSGRQDGDDYLLEVVLRPIDGQ